MHRPLAPWLVLIAALAGPAWADERVLTLEVHQEGEALFVVPTAGPTGIVTELDPSDPGRLEVAPGPAARALPRFAGRVIRVRGAIEDGRLRVERLLSPRRVTLHGTYDASRQRLLTRDGAVALRGVIPPPAAAGALAIRGWSYEDGLEVDAFRGWLSADVEAADGPLAAGTAVWLRGADEDFLIAGTRPTRVGPAAIRFTPEALSVAPRAPVREDPDGLPGEAPVVPLRLLQRQD
ncbi:MAG: hypothetical protein R3F62_02215 [Planctomycetota bacterium]